MPRAPRIETNEGIFHVINRGNYRSFIFEDEGAKASFEKCLFEAAERSGWLVMAYCIMGNHFHLCIATPRGNLSEGMRWLQSTYAARYNRFRKEQGHLFQGRFKSLVVEPGKHLCDLIDYIHLNPVRAKIVHSSNAKNYRWSSLHWLPKIKTRPKILDTGWLDDSEVLRDTPAGWRSYTTSLQMRLTENPEEIEALEKRMCRGWCIGDKPFKQAHAKDFLAKKETLRLEKEGLADLNESHWENALSMCLEKLGESQAAARDARMSAPWKLAIAAKLKSTTSVKNAWLADKLKMGTPRGLSSNLSVYAKKSSDCNFRRKLVNLRFDV